MTPTRCRYAALLALVALIFATGCQQAPSDPGMRETPEVVSIAPGAQGTAVVESVHDGDTFRLRGLGKVRAIGIDAPELADEAQCFVDRVKASTFAETTLTGKEVKYTIGKEPRDRYGRVLVYLKVNQRVFNALMIKKGFAWPLAIKPNTKYAGRFQQLADEARDAGRGLWPKCPRYRG